MVSNPLQKYSTDIDSKCRQLDRQQNLPNAQATVVIMKMIDD